MRQIFILLFLGIFINQNYGQQQENFLINSSGNSSQFNDLKIFWGIGTLIHDNKTKVQKKTFQLNVYPNPCENNLFLEFESQNYIIRIINIDGVVLQIKNCTASNINLDLANLDNGLYFIEVNDLESNQLYVNKILKMSKTY